jgi:hemolysin activation/secretion protein
VFTWHAIWNQKYRLSEDVILDYEIKYFKSQTKKRSFFARLNAIWTENLNSNQQVVLGGATGVRGFDKRMQVGDKRLVLTLEERQYTDYHLFNLAYVGYAAFIDIGRAWQSGTDDGLEDKLLADIGFGIRLASSKADAGRIMHIDFALPLTNRDDPDIDNFLVALKVKNSL